MDLSKLYNCSETTIRTNLKQSHNPDVMIKMKHRNTKEKEIKSKLICAYEDCNIQINSGTFCEKHISILERNLKIHEIVDELKIKFTIINNNNKLIIYKDVGFFAIVILDYLTKLEKVITLVDLIDYKKVSNYTWGLSTNGYIYTRINKKVYLLHRFVLNFDEAGMEVDHENRNKLDNRKNNLRICTFSQNNANMKQLINNTSGVTGVTWDKSRDKWKASINMDSKSYYLGRYNTIKEAAQARIHAEKILHNEFAPIERKIITEEQFIEMIK